MTLKTSLVITGDSSVAKREVDQLRNSIDAAAASSRAAAPAAATLDAAQKQVAASARDEKAAIAEANAEIAAAAQATRAISAANTTFAASAGTSTDAAKRQGNALRDNTKAINDNDAANRRHEAGARNFYQQLGDTLVMVQGGIDPVRAFTTQSSQMGYALSEMGGTAGKVGAILSGPLGLGLSLVLGLAGPLAMSLLNGADAARQQADRLADAANAADSYGNAQSLLGKVVDLTTGKLKTQNDVLVQTIKLQAQANILAAQKEQRTAAEALRGVGQPTRVETLSAGLVGTAKALLDPSYERGAEVKNLAARLAPVKAAVEDYVQLTSIPGASQSALDKGLDATIRRIDALSAAGKLAGRDAIEAKQAVLALGTTLNDQRANQLVLDALNGKGVAAELKPYDRGSKKKPPKAPSTAGVEEFGRDAADRITSITERFSDVPPVIRQIASAGRELDDMIDDLARKKPPGFEKLIADARAAKAAIEQNINKPVDDYLELQRQAYDIAGLVGQGRTIEAQALRDINQLEKQRGTLSAEQRAAVLASVAGLRQQERQLERIRSLQQVNLNALQDMQGIITQSIYEGPQSLADLPDRMLDSFKRFQAELISEQLFGEMFRDLRDQVLGANKVDQASNTIVASFARVASSADQLSARLSGAGTASSAGTAGAGVDGPDIVVTGRRDSDARRASDIYGDAIAKGLGKIGLGQDAASTIGKFAGKGLAGAFEGQAAAGMAGMLGIKTSSAGSAVGGAIGNFLPIPGGSIVGGLLGGVLGGLFQKPKAGTASLTSNDAAATVTGNNASVKAAASGAAGAVQQGIAQIAEQLGGELGKYAVSIGTFDGKYRVSTTGFGGQLDSKTARGQGLKDFGKNGEGAAIAYAIQDAIADGAIQGISDAVSRALRSSTDIDKALKEALKVQEVELISGGIAAEYAKAFADIERQAKERVRIASQYGFDVVAIEKRNAEDRAKLTDQLLKAQVGSLQSLVDEMTSGSLFEGTAMEQIEAVNAKIAKARTDLDAGVAGAGDTLAGLLQQRLELSKNAYGTTGAYAADRTATLNEANAAIARANAQITAANKSDPALATTNAALDENNDQNAQMLAALKANNELLQRLAISTGASRPGSNFPTI